MFVGCGVVVARPRAVTFGPFPISCLAQLLFVLFWSNFVVLFPESIRGFAPFRESTWALPLFFYDDVDHFIINLSTGISRCPSAFVFLSLVLSQRKREMAILQAIGASPNQVMRLVLFEILAIVISSMALGLVLGAGVAQSFNGFFSIFGFIFQIFGGASTVIDRELVWPWFDLAIVSVAVLSAVLVALTTTTFRALRSDLAVVLKGE